MPESLIEFERPHTVRADVLLALAQRGKRRASVKELFREHLNAHFGQTFARIGLPIQYPTAD
ncbi:MAG: hypothetical protein K2W96_06120 [Gemmataceae bacterium]|nr:hypothetical protein [Gemmataceae bacterium]